MSSIIQPGKIQTLLVHSIEGKFVHLGDEHDQVPLLRRDFPGQAEEGKEVTVFTFFDNNKQLIATTQLPSIEVGDVGSFKIKNTNTIGAFIDIGTERDILIPFPEQKDELEEGRWALVILLFDEMSQRVFASTKLTKHLKNHYIPFERGDEVDMIIGERMEFGRRVIIEGKYLGVLFKQEMLRDYGEGDKCKGYIRKVEGTEITVSTQKEGVELIEEAMERILSVLESNKGYLRLSDESEPEEIKRYLTMSKKTFKKACGQLYKEQKITLTDRGIRLGGTTRIQEGDGEVKPYRKRITVTTSERNTVGGRRNREEGERRRADEERGQHNEHNEEHENSKSFEDQMSEGRPRGRGNSNGDERRSDGDRDNRARSESGERRSYGDRDNRARSESGERRSYGDRDNRAGARSGERKSFGDRDRAPRSEGSGERRSYGDRDNRARSESGERRSYGDRDRKPRPEGSGERRSYGDRDRAPRSEGSGERRSYGDRDNRAGSRSGERRSDNGERRSYGDRPPRREGDGERRSYGDRDNRAKSESGERRSYGDRDKRAGARSGERRSDNGERRSYGERDNRTRSESGERRSYGDRPPRRDGDDKDKKYTYGERAQRGPSRNRFEKEIDKSEKRQHEKSKPKFEVKTKSKTFNNPNKGKPKRKG